MAIKKSCFWNRSHFYLTISFAISAKMCFACGNPYYSGKHFKIKRFKSIEDWTVVFGSEPDTTYVVDPFPLTHKGRFSMLLFWNAASYHRKGLQESQSSGTCWRGPWFALALRLLFIKKKYFLFGPIFCIIPGKWRSQGKGAFVRGLLSSRSKSYVFRSW